MNSQIPSDWSYRSLADCGQWLSGGTPNKSKPDYWGGDIPWISAKSMHDFFICDSEDRVTVKGSQNGTRIIPENTVLFVVRGMSLAHEFRLGITHRPVAFNQDLKAIIPSEGILPMFLAYALRSIVPKIMSLVDEASHGTRRLTTNVLSELQIPIPPFSEQEQIVDIIRAFDDKIELNRQMNATLEEMARALFKSWFVDFDPVRRNQAGQPSQPYDHLFPDKLVVDGNGRGVPKGWRIEPLDKIAHYQNGLALQKFPPKGADYLPVIKIRELRQGFVDANSNQASTQINESCILHDGDVVFSWSGSLLVDIWCGGKGALNQHLFKVTSDRYPKWFYYFWTKHHLDEFQRIAAGKATTMGHIQRKHLTAAITAVPPKDLLDALSQIMQSLVEQIIVNRLESRTLADLRDALLPRLMSGRLRVPQFAELPTQPGKTL